MSFSSSSSDSKNSGYRRTRMAGDYMRDFANNLDQGLQDRKERRNNSTSKISDKIFGENYGIDTNRFGKKDDDDDGVMSKLPKKNLNQRNKEVRSMPVGEPTPYNPRSTNNATSSGSSNKQSSNDYTPNFQGGTAGKDYPDPTDGTITVNPNGTKSQITADGKRIEWGKDEALQSAIKSKEDKKFSVTNRKIDYNTNLPSDFDPAGKDAYGHNMWLYELTGNDHFLNAAQGMANL